LGLLGGVTMEQGTVRGIQSKGLRDASPRIYPGVDGTRNKK
jgi:hypothetical protein